MKHLKGTSNVLLNSEHFWDHMTRTLLLIMSVFACCILLCLDTFMFSIAEHGHLALWSSIPLDLIHVDRLCGQCGPVYH